MKVIALLAVVLSSTACGTYESDPTNQATPADPTVVETVAQPPAPPTPDQWRAALESAYTAKDVKDEGDGVTTFSACFNDPGSRCENFAFGTKDGFRKVWHFTPGFLSETAVLPHLISYVAVAEGALPRLLLAPMVIGEHGAVGMQSVALMIDGQVELEQDFAEMTVKREDFGSRVQERVDFIASDEQISALRKINKDSKLLIRISGQNGYVSYDKDQMDNVRVELLNLVTIYDRILAATKDKVIPK